MAISDAYATVADYTSLVTKRSDADNLIIAEEAKSISRLIDSLMHQFFSRDASAVARTFIGDGSRCLRVYGPGNCPGIADTTGMTVELDSGLDGTYATTLTSLQYETRGFGDNLNTELGPEPEPYRELYLPTWTTASYGCWPSGMRVRVTAIYGWPSVPRLIKDLALLWLKIWRLEGPEGTGQINELGSVYAVNADVKRLMDRAAGVYWLPVVA